MAFMIFVLSAASLDCYLMCNGTFVRNVINYICMKLLSRWMDVYEPDAGNNANEWRSLHDFDRAFYA